MDKLSVTCYVLGSPVISTFTIDISLSSNDSGNNVNHLFDKVKGLLITNNLALFKVLNKKLLNPSTNAGLQPDSPLIKSNLNLLAMGVIQPDHCMERIVSGLQPTHSSSVEDRGREVTPAYLPLSTDDSGPSSLKDLFGHADDPLLRDHAEAEGIIDILVIKLAATPLPPPSVSSTENPLPSYESSVRRPLPQQAAGSSRLFLVPSRYSFGETALVQSLESANPKTSSKESMKPPTQQQPKPQQQQQERRQSQPLEVSSTATASQFNVKESESVSSDSLSETVRRSSIQDTAAIIVSINNDISTSRISRTVVSEASSATDEKRTNTKGHNLMKKQVPLLICLAVFVACVLGAVITGIVLLTSKRANTTTNSLLTAAAGGGGNSASASSSTAPGNSSSTLSTKEPITTTSLLTSTNAQGSVTVLTTTITLPPTGGVASVGVETSAVTTTTTQTVTPQGPSTTTTSRKAPFTPGPTTAACTTKILIDDFSFADYNQIYLDHSDKETMAQPPIYQNKELSFIPKTDGSSYFCTLMQAYYNGVPTKCVTSFRIAGVRYFAFELYGEGAYIVNVRAGCLYPYENYTTSQLTAPSDWTLMSVDIQRYVAQANLDYVDTITWSILNPTRAGTVWGIRGVYGVNDLDACGFSGSVAL